MMQIFNNLHSNINSFLVGIGTVVAASLCHSLVPKFFGQLPTNFRLNLILSGTKLFAAIGIITLLTSCQSNLNMKGIHTHAFRLKPGEDLRQSINHYVQQNKIRAGWIGTCVGSLTKYQLRFANQPESSIGFGHFEIVSLSGTVSDNGSHLHMSISDSTGRTIGGHLQDGNIVYTTAEIVILSTDEFEFTREKDGTTAWEELQVKRK